MKFEENYVVVPRIILNHCNHDMLVLPIFIYFAMRRGLNDYVGCSINDIVDNIGHSNHTQKILQDVKNILNYLQDNDFITLEQFDKNKNNSLVKVKLNIEYFDIRNSYCCLSISEIDKIINYRNYVDIKSSGVIPAKLFYILTYIRMNKLRRAPNQQSHPYNKPEFFYKQFKDISDNLNMGYRTVMRGIHILEKLDIIATKKMSHYLDAKGNWHTGTTLFVDKYDGWEQELEWGVDLLKSGKKPKYKQGEGVKENDK